MIKKDYLEIQRNICLSFSSISLFFSLLKKQKIAYFSSDYDHLIKIKDEIKSLDPDIKVLILSNFDCSFFSNLSPTRDVLSERAKTLYELIFPDKYRIIVLINSQSIVNKVIPFNEIKKRKLVINENNKNIYEKIIDHLNENMFEHVEFVRNKGEFAIRGDIIDVFSPNENHPVRISFNFDDIESLYLFNLENQKSFKKVEKYVLFIASEIIFNDSTIKNFRESFRKLKIINKEEYYKSISNKILLPGSGQFHPILFKKFESIISYLKNFSIFIENDFFTNFETHYRNISDEFDSINKFILQESTFLQTRSELEESLGDKEIFVFYNYRF